MRTAMLLTVENWVKSAYTGKAWDAGPEYDLYTSGTVSVNDTREDAGREGRICEWRSGRRQEAAGTHMLQEVEVIGLRLLDLVCAGIWT